MTPNSTTHIGGGAVTPVAAPSMSLDTSPPAEPATPAGSNTTTPTPAAMLDGPADVVGPLSGAEIGTVALAAFAVVAGAGLMAQPDPAIAVLLAGAAWALVGGMGLLVRSRA